jgi:hypothetical protein
MAVILDFGCLNPLDIDAVADAFDGEPFSGAIDHRARGTGSFCSGEIAGVIRPADFYASR